MGNFYGFGSKTNKQIRFTQAKAALFLSVLFIVVYGACNQITSLRPDVGTLNFEWEKYIPLIPVMIIPYMSIDLFFVGAPFLCQSKQELQIFSKRIVMAIMCAGLIFLLMPMKFAYPRPEVSGWTGPLFRFLHGFDQPYNLFPSLHITLRTLLADKYAAHTKGSLKWSLHLWFSLIGFSTLFTWQHHILDIVGGFILAAFCFYFIGEPKERAPVIKNKQVGLYYFVVSIVSLILTFVFWPWGALFLWPAFSLGTVGMAYFGLGPGIFRKEKGRHTLSTKIIFAPYLFGQYLSVLYYKRQANDWDEIVPGLWLGRKLNNKEAGKAIDQGVSAILDVTTEFSEAKPFLEKKYLNIPILDLTAPTQEHLKIAHNFIEQNIKTGPVYIHCKIGYSRSAAVVGSYLIKTRKAKTAAEAIELMKKKRPSLIIRAEAIEAIREFHKNHGN